MPEYRRNYVKGGTYFFTIVTYNRYPVFTAASSVRLFNSCLQTIIENRPFQVDAIVVLPDHIHTIWTLPDDDSDYSTRWKLIKGTFSQNYFGMKDRLISESMFKKNESGIWQRRFWEHTIRSEEDFNKHCDYIHYNPVKHGLVKMPAEWEHSSFRNYVQNGYYPLNWGSDMSEEVLALDLE